MRSAERPPSPQVGAAAALGEPELLLSCESLVVGYRGKPLLPPISLQVRRGTFLAVVGRNGSGKSTWFKTLLGLQAPVSGRVVKAGAHVRCAYVPQSTSIDPLLPVRTRELVGWGLLSGWSFLRPYSTRVDRQRVEAALEAAGAQALGARPYHELSEGQRQRTLLARVLATQADLVLLDEPTAAMDAVAERETLERLAHLARERRMAVVVVSHDLRQAASVADTLLFLDREGPAVLVGGARTVFSHPAFRRQYGDEYSASLTSGHPSGHTSGHTSGHLIGNTAG